MEVKFNIPTIIVEPTLDVAQHAIADVSRGILDANKSKNIYFVKFVKFSNEFLRYMNIKKIRYILDKRNHLIL